MICRLQVAGALDSGGRCSVVTMRHKENAIFLWIGFSLVCFAVFTLTSPAYCRSDTSAWHRAIGESLRHELQQQRDLLGRSCWSQ
jgi:hypothetical protein